jgi:FkbM family methyltransferase
MMSSQSASVATELLRLHSLAPFYAPLDAAERRRSNHNLVELFYGILREYQPALFVEAGAKNAPASVRARKFLPQSSIVAFEANPYNYKQFSERPELRAANVQYLLRALSDTDGPVTFNVQTRVDGREQGLVAGNNSILKRSDDNREYEEVTVEGVALDTFFANEPAATCALWVDVEGASGPVLRGADELLKKAGLILIEVEDKQFWREQWLTEQVVEHLSGKGFVAVARDFEYRSQHNILFVSPDVARTEWFKSNLDYFFAKLVAKIK